MDPLTGSPWSAPGTVAGFVRSPPNDVLMQFARRELERIGAGRLLDVGCGASRNAVPLAQLGWDVVGTDLSSPMLEAAAERARAESVTDRLRLILAPMDKIPIADGSVDMVVAHGIWNLATSAHEFRRGVNEAARVSRSGAALFVFTFSRNTLPPDVQPVAGEPFVFTEFSGRPQCFLTEAQLIDELGAFGFVRESSVPLSEYNRPGAGMVSGGAPVIYEAAFRRRKIQGS